MPSIMINDIKGISPLTGSVKGIKMHKEKVNHPEHYNPGVYEVINIIEYYNLGFHLGNVLKYILRADKKHDTPKEDIEKAIWYLQRYRDSVLIGKNNEEAKEGSSATDDGVSNIGSAYVASGSEYHSSLGDRI